MIRKLSLAITIILLLGSALAIQAQDTVGTISGTVYRTENPGTSCTEDNLPGEPGIPLQFVNRDNQTTLNLNTESDGSYEINVSTEGTWQVTVNPGSGWRVLSQQTIQVSVSEDDPDHEEVDFCITRVTPTPTTTTITPTPTTITPTPIPPVLPESGAPVAPTLLLAAGLGFLFLLIGGWLFVYARKS
jgi:hypothetical protein